MNLLQTAQFWTQQGYSVIPIRYQSKKPDVRRLPLNESGEPTWEIFQNRPLTNTELLQMFPGRLNNLALITGNGLVVVDFDIQEVFDYWFTLFPIETYMVKTRRGVHVYLKTIEPAKNYHSPLLDIKAERGYVLIPPSIHPSGYEYQIFKDAPIMQVNKLEDVLPKSFIPEPEKVDADGTQYVMGNFSDDPWEIADQAVEINKEIIDQIKTKVKITDLIQAEPSSSDGRWFVAKCPFHHDRSPSFWIDLHRGMCGCRKCNIKEMDVINLYARLNHLSNQDAIKKLVNNWG